MATVTAAGIWAETRAVVARHRGTLLTLAAATVFLPNAAVRLVGPNLPAGTGPATLPPGFWLMLATVLALQFAGLFAIAAITADRNEGGGRTLGETLGAALPALGKFALALVVFVFAYFIASLVVGLVLAVIAAIFMAASPAALASAQKGEPPMALAALVVAVVVPLMIYAWARLSPLVGIYLREPTGVIDGIRRAWTLSRGSAASIMALLTALVLASLGLAWIQSGLSSGGLPELAGVALDLVGAAAGALIFTYAAAGTGVVYRQLTR